MVQLQTVGLLLISNRKLLLAYSRNKECFYLPGGKVNNGESSRQALIREVAEELNVMIDETALRYYTHISAPAYGEEAGVMMEPDVSEPIANGTSPAPTTAPEPLDEPPAHRSGSHGFRCGPCSEAQPFV